MHRSGRFGDRFAWVTWLVVAAFVGCGGSSKNNDGSEGGDQDDDRGGTAGASAGSDTGGSVGASPGSGGAVSGAGPRGGSAGTLVPPPGTVYCGGEPCDAPLSCCMSTGRCFDPQSDADACATPDDPDGDPDGRRPCAANSQCGLGEFCMLDGLSCQGTGHCQPTGDCGSCSGSNNEPSPACRVCGCDGNTYPSQQDACRAGANALWTQVGCGEPATEGGAGASSIPMRTYVPCGHDGQCPSGNFCCAIDSRCHAEADREICVPPPPGARFACRTTADCGDREYCSGEGCDARGGCVQLVTDEDCGVIIDAVCGCDGTSYTSAACASSRGVRVAHEGQCNDAGG